MLTEIQFLILRDLFNQSLVNHKAIAIFHSRYPQYCWSKLIMASYVLDTHLCHLTNKTKVNVFHKDYIYILHLVIYQTLLSKATYKGENNQATSNRDLVLQ